jgi:hypothetical protein
VPPSWSVVPVHLGAWRPRTVGLDESAVTGCLTLGGICSRSQGPPKSRGSQGLEGKRISAHPRGDGQVTSTVGCICLSLRGTVCCLCHDQSRASVDWVLSTAILLPFYCHRIYILHRSVLPSIRRLDRPRRWPVAIRRCRLPTTGLSALYCGSVRSLLRVCPLSTAGLEDPWEHHIIERFGC